MENKQISTGWIIFWMVLFWPVGVFLLVKRMSSSKDSKPKSYRAKSKNMSIWSWVLIFFGMVGITGAITDGDFSTALLSTVIFILPGILMNKIAKKMKDSAEFKEEYVDEAVKEAVDSIKEMIGKNPKEAFIEKVAKICSGCGASISGPKGQVIVCDYCTSNQKL